MNTHYNVTVNFYRLYLSYTFLASLGLCFTSPAYAIKPENVNDLAESIVQSMKGSNTDPSFKRGPIQEIQPLMRVKASLLKDIRQFGLLNQHQTYTSGGELDPSSRGRTENQMQGLDHLGLSTGSPAELYPKYGYMNYKTDGQERARQASGITAVWFGDVIFVFKQDDPKLLSRITYSLDDSLRGEAIYPLNYLVPLEEFQNGKRRRGRYRELQFWGTLDLNDVQEVWLTLPLSTEDKEILKEIAQTYGLPVYQTDKNQGSDFEHLQLTRTRDPDLSGTARSEERPFKKMTGPELIEYYKNTIEPDLKDKPKHYQAQVKESIITSLLAERGQVEDLPPKLKNEVQERIEESRKNLMALATGNRVPPRVRASALHALLDETWPSPWLTQSEYEKIVPHLFVERVLKELENRYYKTGPALVKALRKHMPEIEKGIDVGPIIASYLISSISSNQEKELRGTRTIDEFLTLVRQPESQTTKQLARDQAVAKSLDHWLTLRPEAAKTEMLIQDLVQRPDAQESFITGINIAGKTDLTDTTGAASSLATRFLTVTSPACSSDSPAQKKACQEILSETTAYFLTLKPTLEEGLQILQRAAPEEALQDTVALPIAIYAGKLALSRNDLTQLEKIRDIYCRLTDARSSDCHKKAEFEFELLKAISQGAANDSDRMSKLLPFLDSKNAMFRKAAAEELANAIAQVARRAPTTDRQAQVEAFKAALGSQASIATIAKILKEKGFDAKRVIESKELPQEEDIAVLMHLIEALQKTQAKGKVIYPVSCTIQ